MTKAFEGIKVLDLSDRLSGAWAARLFGDFGAEVIKIEPPKVGDSLRPVSYTHLTLPTNREV